MTVVYLTDGEHGSYENVDVKVSGWAFCRDTDGNVDAYPPHRIERITERGYSDKERGERLSSQSPHGRL